MRLISVFENMMLGINNYNRHRNGTDINPKQIKF